MVDSGVSLTLTQRGIEKRLIVLLIMGCGASERRFPCGAWERGENLFTTGKYDWCLFIGHLVLEKILKAIFVQDNDNNLPPKTHNLIKLAEKTHIKLTEDQKIFFDEVNDFNLEVRYPQFKNEFHKQCTNAFTERYFKQIESTAKWLKSQIKSLP